VYTIGRFQSTISPNTNTHKIGKDLPGTCIPSKHHLSNSSLSPRQDKKKSKFFMSLNNFAVLIYDTCDGSDALTPSNSFKDDLIKSPHTDLNFNLSDPPLFIKNIQPHSDKYCRPQQFYLQVFGFLSHCTIFRSY